MPGLTGDRRDRRCSGSLSLSTIVCRGAVGGSIAEIAGYREDEAFVFGHQIRRAHFNTRPPPR